MKYRGNVFLRKGMHGKAKFCINFFFIPTFLISHLTNPQRFLLTCKNHVYCSFADAIDQHLQAKPAVNLLISHQKHRAVISCKNKPKLNRD